MQITAREKSSESQNQPIMKYWAYFQHEMLFISWGVMDLALLVPVALTLMPWARDRAGLLFLGLLLLMLVSFNLARLMGALQLRPSIQQTVMAITLTLIIILTLRRLFYEPQSLFDMSWLGQFFSYVNTPGNALWLRDVMLFVLMILMWARGIQMANRIFTIDRIGLRLRVGGLLIAPLVIVISNRFLDGGATPFILLFCLAGLTAVALTRAEEISREETGFSASLTPRWLLFIFAAGLFIVFSAGIIAILISGESGTAIVGILNPIWLAIKATAAVAIATIGYLLQPIFSVLDWLFDEIVPAFSFLENFLNLIIAFLIQVLNTFLSTDISNEDGDFIGLFSGSSDDGNLEPGFNLSTNEQIIFVLLAVAVILLVALMLRRIYQATAVAEHNAVRSRKQRDIDSNKPGLMERVMGKLGWRNWHTAVSIRRIYKQMMHAAAAGGFPKLQSETPYEYLNTLYRAWPHNVQDVQIITEAYVNIRYGELPETDEELSHIRQAWRHIEKAQPTTNPPTK